jgi:hypothetical protein
MRRPSIRHPERSELSSKVTLIHFLASSSSSSSSNIFE